MNGYSTAMRQQNDVRKYRPRSELHIALEYLDLSFYVDEVKSITDWWYEGKSVAQMAENLQRPVAEIAVLLLDLSDRGKLEQRPGGLFVGLDVKN